MEASSKLLKPRFFTCSGVWRVVYRLLVVCSKIVEWRVCRLRRLLQPHRLLLPAPTTPPLNPSLTLLQIHRFYHSLSLSLSTYVDVYTHTYIFIYVCACCMVGVILISYGFFHFINFFIFKYVQGWCWGQQWGSQCRREKAWYFCIFWVSLLSFLFFLRVIPLPVMFFVLRNVFAITMPLIRILWVFSLVLSSLYSIWNIIFPITKTLMSKMRFCLQMCVFYCFALLVSLVFDKHVAIKSKGKHFLTY